MFKLYRTSLNEEKQEIQDKMMECRNYEIESSDFSQTLKENMTETNLADEKLKNFHYAFLLKKKAIAKEKEVNN